ncbi:S-adenosyl-L-methionine-dependent methyltransferase [Phaeosphaeriaceae sp. PMI808]|nr:S-adenosyl-L-methionine-dependent methyltransferase [Phaeosphaeriaceae sp. PMI808]
MAFVRSELASKDTTHDIWYRLRNPHASYRRYHEPFLWVAQLAKHVIDFISVHSLKSVGLQTFRTDFHQWLLQRFAKIPSFTDWHLAFQNRVDFRIAINAHIEFLYREAYNLPDSKLLLAHPLWAHCMARGLTAIEPQPKIIEYTLATSYVHEHFEHMYFGGRIHPRPVAESVRAQQDFRKRQLGFLDHVPTSIEPSCQAYKDAIKIGDIVGFDPDKKDQQKWKDTNGKWLAYVQDVQLLASGAQRLGVIFMYRPRDTNIFKAKYPLQNELFFSDNCNCGDGELLSTDLVGKYHVDWKPTTATRGYFVRQTYITQESAFATLKEEHKTCRCKKIEASPSEAYHCGDTVYMRKTIEGQSILDPVVIHHIDKSSRFTTIRKLQRLDRDYRQLAIESGRHPNIAKNELVLTDNYETVENSQLQRRCYVRFLQKKELHQGQVPFPYNLHGTGDFWFISMGITSSRDALRLIYLTRLPNRFNEGPDINIPIQGTKKLKGLSIFSGGGNFDRGLEEGGAVEFRAAVDMDASAIHTQKANSKDSSKLKLYLGSVDDILELVMSGKKLLLGLRIGKVEFISAGTPCPGFSSLQKYMLSIASLINASHITTFCTFVDIYRPLFGMVENVVNIGATRSGLEDQNTLSQLIACLVSMGYQVSQFLMDAWSYGSGQQRSRIIIAITAPGLHPIDHPWHSHSMPYQDTLGKSLGKLPNGQRFGEREFYPTPFKHRSAGEITSNLPKIGNGNVHNCISYPDHRVPYPPAVEVRELIKRIPQAPPGCGYKEASQANLIPPELQRPGKEVTKAFRRIKEGGLIPTITTNLSPQDAHNGACLHWLEDRSITLQEAREAQGIPDEEVIIGSLGEQYRIVGNGVDRRVSFALGLRIRQAVKRNIENGKLPMSSSILVEEMLVDVEDVDGGNDATMSRSSTFASAEMQNTKPTSLGQPTTLLQAKRSLHLGSEIQLQNKRSREDAEQGPDTRCNQAMSRKQRKLQDEKSSLYDRETIAVITPYKMRQTRHSGLEATFTPKRWDRKPEN